MMFLFCVCVCLFFPAYTSVQRSILHDLVLYELGCFILSRVLLVQSRQDKVLQPNGNNSGEPSWISRQRFHWRAFLDEMQFVLLFMGRYQLHVHSFAENTFGYRCYGTIRYQRLVRLSFVVGHTSRAIRRCTSKKLIVLFFSSHLFNKLMINIHLQIVAVILCDTGIALLAYMDGITGSPTLGGVVLAASAAAGSAVYKVTRNNRDSYLFILFYLNILFYN